MADILDAAQTTTPTPPPPVEPPPPPAVTPPTPVVPPVDPVIPPAPPATSNDSLIIPPPEPPAPEPIISSAPPPEEPKPVEINPSEKPKKKSRLGVLLAGLLLLVITLPILTIFVKQQVEIRSRAAGTCTPGDRIGTAGTCTVNGVNYTIYKARDANCNTWTTCNGVASDITPAPGTTVAPPPTTTAPSSCAEVGEAPTNNKRCCTGLIVLSGASTCTNPTNPQCDNNLKPNCVSGCNATCGSSGWICPSSCITSPSITTVPPSGSCTIGTQHGSCLPNASDFTHLCMSFAINTSCPATTPWCCVPKSTTNTPTILPGPCQYSCSYTAAQCQTAGGTQSPYACPSNPNNVCCNIPSSSTFCTGPNDIKMSDSYGCVLTYRGTFGESNGQGCCTLGHSPNGTATCTKASILTCPNNVVALCTGTTWYCPTTTNPNPPGWDCRSGIRQCSGPNNTGISQVCDSTGHWVAGGGLSCTGSGGDSGGVGTGTWFCGGGRGVPPPNGTQCTNGGTTYQGMCAVYHCPKGCNGDTCGENSPGFRLEFVSCASASLANGECGQIDTVDTNNRYCIPGTPYCDVKDLNCTCAVKTPTPTPTRTPTVTGTPSLTRTPTPTTTVAPQCINIVAYDTNGNALSGTELSALQQGDTITLAFAPGGAATKVRFRVNSTNAADWHETTTKNTNGQFIWTYTLENVTSFTIEAQWFDGTTWISNTASGSSGGSSGTTTGSSGGSTGGSSGTTSIINTITSLFGGLFGNR